MNSVTAFDLIINMEPCYLNFGCLVFMTCLMSYLYLRSIQPVQMQLNEDLSTQKSYHLSCLNRWLSFIPYMATCYYFIGYTQYPMSDIEQLLHVPSDFDTLIPTQYRSDISCFIGFMGLIICIKAIYDAGKETMTPQGKGRSFGGIYNYMRHPQMFGEWLIFFGIATFLNSPFLFLYTLIILGPVLVYLGKKEETDLVIRYGDDYIQYMQNTPFWIEPLVSSKLDTDIDDLCFM